MATRFVQNYISQLIEEQHGSYNIPVDDLRKELSRLSAKSPLNPMNVLKKAVGKGKDFGSIVRKAAKSAPTDDGYEGRRAEGVRDRLAAGEQIAPPSGGQVMGMRATSPADEKRIEDLAKARPRSGGGGGGY